MTARWIVVVPVKAAPAAKSRLAHPDRIDLARAIALDTIAAAVAASVVAEVRVVTADAVVAREAARLGASVVDEESERGAVGIDGALALAMAAVDTRMPRAALLGDLPALRPTDLADALKREL